MKLEKIHIKNKNCIKNLKLSFLKNGKILDMVIFFGENGIGKKTILDEISNQVETQYISSDVGDIIHYNSEKFITEKIFNKINEVFFKIFPKYKNIKNKTELLKKLSKSELQIYGLILTLIYYKEQVDVIVIDRFENDLHPNLQQKIIDIIEMVEDNYEKKYQFFIVTNSPFILNSVKNNNIFCLERKENKVICKTGDELYSTYGQSVDRILKDIMGLKTTRNIAIENKINELRKMIDENEYNSEEFKIKFNNLKEILGNSDEDIFLMEIDIKSKEKK